MFEWTTKPDMPLGFVDRSYKNDICSHWEMDLGKYIIAVWVNYDDPDRREEDWQYAVGIRETDEYENGSFVYFDEPDLYKASARIRAEVFKLLSKYKHQFTGGKMEKDKSLFFKVMEDLRDYQVGDEFYLLKDNKIIKGSLYRVTLEIHNSWTPPKFELSKKFTMELYVEGNLKVVEKNDLFKTREDAAERFLQDNDVPGELLRVLKQEKPKTTVADLIEKLKNVDPDTDLEDKFQDIVNSVIVRYITHE